MIRLDDFERVKRMTIWSVYEIPPDNFYYFKIGSLAVWLKRSQKEWLIATENDFSKDKGIALLKKISLKQADREKMNWNRWITEKKENKLFLKPVLPDRALVIRPKFPVKIISGQEAMFFINIPVWLQLKAGEEEKILCELPVEKMSNTWFGDFAQGELCYSHKTEIQLKPDMAADSELYAACPLKIKNDSKDILDFRRICLHVEYLNLYQGDKRLWTNRVNISFKGQDKASQINIGRKTPDYGKNVKLISPSRLKADTSLFKKSFQFIKDLTGF
jgi:hypothetical protein